MNDFYKKLELSLINHLSDEINGPNQDQDAFEVISEIVASTAVFYENQIYAFIKINKKIIPRPEIAIDELLKTTRENLINRLAEDSQ